MSYEQMSYKHSLDKFALAIIEDDMGDDVLEKQKRLFGDCVKNILPVDSVSYPNRCIFFSQLIETRGDIGERIRDMCITFSSAEAQDQCIFSASAASGTGKTHGVYAAGKHLLSLVERVGNSSDEINGQAELSSPWKHLVNAIEGIVKYFTGQCGVVNVADLPLENAKECAHYAYKCIKLLVCCYVAVSIDVLSLEAVSSLTPAKQREFILRFHRNGISENLVRDRFILELDHNCTSITTECHLLATESVDNFCTELKVRGESLEHQILICFDEIVALKDYFPYLFIHSDVYAAEEVVGEGVAPDIKRGEEDVDVMQRSDYDSSKCDHTSAEEGYSEPDPEVGTIHRGLLYAVACCMVSLSKSTKWAMIMTGTAFSLTQFSCSGQGLSPVRGCVETVSPEKMLDVSDMCALLQHYFNLSDEALEDNGVVAMLTKCCGRPHIFVNVVFKRIFDKLLSLENKPGVVDVELLLYSWTKSVGTMQATYKRLFNGLLMTRPRVLPSDKDGTTKSLVPLMLSALLFNKGIMNLPNDTVVAEAIRCSIVPVSSSVGDREVDITAEPIVSEALWQVLLELADSRKEMVMRLVLNGVSCQDKGITAESAFSFYLALCSAVKIKKQQPNLLSTLLAPFFESMSHQPNLLSAFTCEVTTIVDMSAWEAEGRCFLWRFIKVDNTYDTSILLVNIPNNAGVDVAFLVVNKSVLSNSPLRYRLVVFQLKNRMKGQLKTALLTLHSGTQYMTNAQREYAIRSMTRPQGTADDVLGRFPKSDSSGIEFSEWRDYHNNFVTNHPMLCDRWIRIAVFAQPIHDDVYEFVQDFPNKICAIYRQQANRARCSTGRTGFESKGGEVDDYDEEEEGGDEDPEVERLRAAADSSPVVVLTMNSKNWLSEQFRSEFIETTHAKLSLPKAHNIAPYLDNLTVYAVRGAHCSHK
jgi:hypothetical protein